jgi:hypothetical protein
MDVVDIRSPFRVSGLQCVGSADVGQDSALVWHVAVVPAIYRAKNMAQRNGMSMLQDHIMKI